MQQLAPDSVPGRAALEMECDEAIVVKVHVSDSYICIYWL